jgi:hypothetical protein
MSRVMTNASLGMPRASRIHLFAAACLLALDGCTLVNRIDTCDEPADRDFQVNSIASGDQYPRAARSLARLPSGIHVAAWTSEESAAENAPTQLRAALFQPDGRIVSPCGSASGDLAISIATDEIVVHPAVAVGPTPTSPIYFTWRASPAGVPYDEVSGRILVRLMKQDLCPWNAKPNDELLFEMSEADENPFMPSIAVRSDGQEALVAWSSIPTSPSDPYRIRSRPVGLTTLLIGGVEPNRCNGLDAPCTHTDRAIGAVSSLSPFQDGYVLAWGTRRATGPGFEVNLLVLDELARPGATGTSSRTFGSVSYVQVAATSYRDTIALAMAGYPSDLTPSPEDEDVFVERFSAEGVSLGAPVRANSERDGAQTSPAIAALDGGAIFVAWSSSQTGGEQSTLHGRVLDATGAPMFTGLACDTDEFPISSSTGTRRAVPSVTADGSEAVVLFGDSTPGPHATDQLGLSVQARRFDLAYLVPGLE